ncbi:MAG: acetoacetate decarboxylase family protein [bacterium]|nr:acetoacetate decarboxylase family protein [bacterium]
MNMKNDPFWDVEKSVFKTSEGDMELPIFYYDFSQVLYLFLVKPGKLRPLLEGTGLKPCVMLNHRAVVMLVFFEYRSTSIGTYNEVGLCSLTYSEKCKKPFFYLPSILKSGDSWKTAAYVHDLPVTTKIANAGGREIYGYPKFVTDIPFSLTPKTFDGAVLDPDTGKNIFSIAGPLSRMGVSFPAIDIVTYTNHKGQQLRTNITTDAKAKYSLFPNMRLKVGESNHRMAKNMRDLGLDNKRPLSIATSEIARSRLPRGIAVTPDMLERIKKKEL